MLNALDVKFLTQMYNVLAIATRLYEFQQVAASNVIIIIIMWTGVKTDKVFGWKLFNYI